LVEIAKSAAFAPVIAAVMAPLSEAAVAVATT
jgi:hypothetical protein